MTPTNFGGGPDSATEPTSHLKWAGIIGLGGAALYMMRNRKLGLADVAFAFLIFHILNKK